MDSLALPETTDQLPPTETLSASDEEEATKIAEETADATKVGDMTADEFMNKDFLDIK
jgi:hypothetical protein